MDSLFCPHSLVVVGVSENPDNLPRVITNNLMDFGYNGDLYLVGRRSGSLNGHAILASLDEIPEGVEMAIVLTPAETIPGIIDTCGLKGIRHVIIETGGFAETNEIGEALGEEILAAARKHGIRLVGPNCIGIISTGSGICSSFIKTEPEEVPPGRVSCISQSGAIVYSLADMLAANGLGVSKTVSVGNKLDYQENDYLQYFLEDESTDVVLMYLEGVNDGRGLVELAGQARKPVIAYKSNTTQASARAAHSHTAALTNDDQVVSAAFRQSGIRRAQTLREMALAAKGFRLPPVRGRRLAVFSRSGGHGTISVDLASGMGFELPPYPQEVLESAKQHFRADIINVANPLDLGTVFNFDSYLPVLRQALDLMQPEAVLFICLFRQEDLPTAERVTRGFKEISQEYQVPVALVYMMAFEDIETLETSVGFPIFTEVADAMLALEANRDFYRFQEKTRAQAGQGREVQAAPGSAAEKVRRILAENPGEVLLTHTALEICQEYGLPVIPWVLAEDAGDALVKAAQVGYPLALKLVAAEAAHKSDVGGVILNIRDEAGLKDALEAMRLRIQEHGIDPAARFLLQKMVNGGREVILGGKQDPSFGPVVLFGMGGIYVEALGDAALRLAPVGKEEAEAMIAEIQGAKILQGMRGEAPADREAMAEALVRLSQLMQEVPEIAEVDLNPMIVFEEGAVVVDARVVRG